MKRASSPGKLRHRVLIERPTDCDPVDPVTDEPQCWETVVECWAAVRPVSAKEIYAAGGFVGQQDVALTVRYDPRLDDMNNHWRVWFQNRKLGVVGKLNIDVRDQWIKILTTRADDDIRLRDPDFDDPLHQAANVVLPGVT